MKVRKKKLNINCKKTYRMVVSKISKFKYLGGSFRTDGKCDFKNPYVDRHRKIYLLKVKESIKKQGNFIRNKYNIGSSTLHGMLTDEESTLEVTGLSFCERMPRIP